MGNNNNNGIGPWGTRSNEEFKLGKTEQIERINESPLPPPGVVAARRATCRPPDSLGSIRQVGQDWGGEDSGGDGEGRVWNVGRGMGMGNTKGRMGPNEAPTQRRNNVGESNEWMAPVAGDRGREGQGIRGEGR